MTILASFVFLAGLTKATVYGAPIDGSQHHRNLINHGRKDTTSCPSGCGENGSCFFQKCYCHPGYDGEGCKDIMNPKNPWYTDDCPNLTPTPHFDINDGRVSSGINCDKHNQGDGPTCKILCFSHPVSGVAQVPIAFWKLSQDSEAQLWARISGSDDRASEHIEGFRSYAALRGKKLGNMIEVGGGPWTQTRRLMEHANVSVDALTILEPNIFNYLKKEDCAYKDGYLRPRGGMSPVPVSLFPHGSEYLHSFHAFDTLLVINVLEHVQNAYKHLTNIYNSIKPGGLLIFHERYFEKPGMPDGVVLGDNLLHPIRVTKVILDSFLSRFEPIMEHWDGTTGFKVRNMQEKGVYFIGTKKTRSEYQKGH